MVKIIWMSDLHFMAEGLVTGHDPRARLEAAIDYVNRNHGDAACCVISGDLVDDPSTGNYAALRSRLDRLAMPYAPMTGNHDERTLLAAGLPLPEGAQDGFVQYSVEIPGAVLLCLDTLVPGSVAGEMCAARLDWLETQLQARPDTPAYVFMHHPPVALGLPMLDGIRLRNGAELLDLLAQFPMVRHIFAGHVHRPCIATASGIPVATMRSVLVQAPAPWPAWDWDGFVPAREAPAIGVIGIDGAKAWAQYVEFCEAGYGVTG